MDISQWIKHNCCYQYFDNVVWWSIVFPWRKMHHPEKTADMTKAIKKLNSITYMSTLNFLKLASSVKKSYFFVERNFEQNLELSSRSYN